MIRFICSVWILVITAAMAGTQQQPLSPRLANYEMDVKLDTESRILDGVEILTWKNNTGHPARELRFHLYYNAWRNDKSSMLNSVRRYWDLSDYGENDWAYCDVRTIERLAGENSPAIDLTTAMRFIAPDDGNPDDRTVLQLSLNEPVMPGEQIRLRISWQSKVPRTFARTGTRGNYYFFGQWFPKIGVLEDNGRWNCHQFIQTEFFADFGVYDVKMTIPSGWVVGSTGKEIDRVENRDGSVTHHYYQEDVHDFAWVTSPEFTVHKELFNEPGLPEVEMRLVLMPDHTQHRDRYFSAAAAALKYYGTWWGAYPYDHITIVDPAYGSRTGGMEYPTLFTGGDRWISPPESRRPEGVTVHEAGHQFWFGIMANNEFEDAWLDEGFNTYSTTRTMVQAFSGHVLERRYFEGFLPIVFPDITLAERTDGADHYDNVRSEMKREIMSTPSWQDGPGSYRMNAYTKPALMLRTLENYLGWETFQKIMSTYFSRWKFRHPKPQDYFDVVNEISDEDMSWFFKETYYNSNIFDYAVGKVASKKVRPAKGYLDRKDEPDFDLHRKAESTDDESIYDSYVYVHRWGEAVFPVEIKVTFEDGRTVDESWEGRRRWIRFDYQGNSKIVKVEVDPRNILVLDVNRSNNSWVKEPRSKMAAVKWASKWMAWLQNLMESFALFS